MSHTVQSKSMLQSYMPGALIAIALLLAAAVLPRYSKSGYALPKMTAEFVVSDARDAGPGTLRDAILAADRLSSRAHISITVRRIALESALPTLINPHGIDIDAAPACGSIEADHLATGAVLEVNSPDSRLKGLSIAHARGFGILVNASNVQIEAVAIADSKVGIWINAAVRDATVRNSRFERDDVAVMTEAGAREITVINDVFRDNTRAAFWFVGVAPGPAAVDHAPPAEREHARLIEDVFENNAAGAVLNQPTLIQRSRFVATRQSAVLILGGRARLEDNDINTSGGDAVSVVGGHDIAIIHNRLSDNTATAILVRDSEATIDRNTIDQSGFGIVAITSTAGTSATMSDNLISHTTGDGITVIGGSALLQRNQILGSRGAGVRVLDLVQAHGSLKATPRLDGNIVKGNGIDEPMTGTYRLAGAL